MSTLRIVSLDEIRQERDELYGSDYMLYTSERRRKLRTLNKACIGITLGFAPLAWDTNRGLLFAHRAICLTCGHIVATRQPSWMEKHAWGKHQHGTSSPRIYGYELLWPEEVS